MKKIIIFLGFLFVSVYSFSQAGYREFLFGMSRTDIRARMPNLTEENDIATLDGIEYTIVMYYLYRTELQTTVPNPSQYIHRDHTSLRNAMFSNFREGGIKFTFVQDKLVSVKTSFSSSVLQELTGRYGNGFVNYIHSKREDGEESRVWLNDNRFIVWCRGRSYNSRSYYELITYIDAVWLRDICERAFASYVETTRQNQEERRTRID